MPDPIQFESLRRSVISIPQIKLHQLPKVCVFPFVKEILKAFFKKSKPLKLAIDRTLRAIAQGIYALVWRKKKRSIPLYWRLLSKWGGIFTSNEKLTCSLRVKFNTLCTLDSSFSPSLNTINYGVSLV